MVVAWANDRETEGKHAEAMAGFDALVSRLTALETELREAKQDARRRYVQSLTDAGFMGVTPVRPVSSPRTTEPL